MSVIENGGMLNVISLNFILVSFKAKFLFHLPNQGIYIVRRELFSKKDNSTHYASFASLFIKIREHTTNRFRGPDSCGDFLL